jgi:uncharacterized protein YegL
VNKKRLIPSLLLSFLIHLAVLTGIDVFLAPTPGMPEWPEFIPVDMVIVKEERGGSRENFTVKGADFSKEPLIAKAERAKGTPSMSPAEDFPGPIPKEGTFQPSLSVEKVPTPGVLPPGQEGKEAASRRVISHSTSPPQRLPEIPPSPSDQLPVLEVETPRVLTMAEKGGIPTDSASLEKITSPLGRNRPHPDVISELPPIPTVKSPAVAEEKEMVLARQPQPHKALIGKPREPLLPGVEKKGTFGARGKGFSVLFVLDNSGSVKGQPLEGIKKSALDLVSLLGEMDQGAVIAFNDEPSLVVSFTSDRKRLKQRITGITTGGKNTVLFDALDLALHLLRKEEERSRFVVLFSDGKDEGSQSTASDVVDRARSWHIAVFCVGYSQVERRYLKTLEDISGETGGLFAEAPQFGEVVELFRAAREVKGKRES